MTISYTPIPPETNVGDATAWIPLTTAFSWSSACTGQFRLDGPSLMAFDPGYGLEVDTNVICQPPAVTTWWEQARLGVATKEGHTAASLQPMICPVAFSTLASSIRDLSSTLALCCPPGYYLEGGDVGQAVGNCLSDVFPGMVLTYASTASGASLSWATATTTLTVKSTVGAIAVVGWNVDRVTSSPLGPTLTSPFTIASPTSSANPGLSATYSERLSTGAKAAIGFGIALGIIGLISLLVTIFLMRRRNRKKERNDLTSHGLESYPSSYELHTKEKLGELASAKNDQATELETIHNIGNIPQ